MVVHHSDTRELRLIGRRAAAATTSIDDTRDADARSWRPEVQAKGPQELPRLLKQAMASAPLLPLPELAKSVFPLLPCECYLRLL